jgi:hypothetical protein
VKIRRDGVRRLCVIRYRMRISYATACCLRRLRVIRYRMRISYATACYLLRISYTTSGGESAHIRRDRVRSLRLPAYGGITYMYIYIHVSMYVCSMYVCIYIYIYTYTYTYTYICLFKKHVMIPS